MAARALAAALTVGCAAGAAGVQHIVFILADDLGYNDVSFHGSPQIPTPNIDALAAPGSGMRLGHLYAAPVCSPTRSSLLSGRHVSHTGVYMPFSEGSNLFLNTSYALLPQYLATAGVASHLVGKYHLGVTDRATTPTARGFASHTGYWMGAETYQTHMAGFQNANGGAFDFHSADLAPDAPDVSANNTWSTELLARRAVQLIQNASATGERLFIYLAMQNIHWPLEAPQQYLDFCANRTGGNAVRQAICGMTLFLDDAVGNVTAALKQTGLWDSTLVVFQADNGGPTNGDEGTFSDNFPLRGGKNTLWEGGTRVVGAVSGGALPAAARAAGTYDGPMHVTDWLPTLVHAATGSANWSAYAPAWQPPFQLGDGQDLWPALAAGNPALSPRTDVLLETHPASAKPGSRVHGDALIMGDWKLIKVDQQVPKQDENGWWLPPGGDVNAPYTVRCDYDGGGPRTGAATDPTKCYSAFCLFNITADPCEYHDLSSENPGVVAQLQARLAQYSATAVPPVAPSGCSPQRVPVAPGGALAWELCSNAA